MHTVESINIYTPIRIRIDICI